MAMIHKALPTKEHGKINRVFAYLLAHKTQSGLNKSQERDFLGQIECSAQR